ncbi:MAG: hypothetical protein K2N43_00830, partial [Lachnospiraceae bacterium]|nr:hypothetical protein [Lachnospiraceae bacterium]
TIISYRQEAAAFHMEAFQKLSDDEIFRVFGHPAFLYYHLKGIMLCWGMDESFQAIEERYQRLISGQAVVPLKKRFCQRFADLRKGTDKLCVFCCGQYGKAVQRALMDFGIEVDFFSDNNPQFWGKRINGCRCISPEDLRPLRERTLAVAALNTPQPVLNQLTDMGFSHIVTKQELESIPY